MSRLVARQICTEWRPFMCVAVRHDPRNFLGQKARRNRTCATLFVLCCGYAFQAVRVTATVVKPNISMWPAAVESATVLLRNRTSKCPFPVHFLPAVYTTGLKTCRGLLGVRRFALRFVTSRTVIKARNSVGFALMFSSPMSSCSHDRFKEFTLDNGMRVRGLSAPPMG